MTVDRDTAVAARPRDGEARGWRLSTRIAALSLGLLLLVQLASFAAINGSIVRNARATVAEELEHGERLLRRLLQQGAHKQHDAAILLAADYGFRSAVSSGDAETIRSALANHSRRIGASTAALLGIDLQLRASTDHDPEVASVVAALGARQDSGQPASALATLRGRPIQLVLVPMKAPRLIGWVVMGFDVERALADDLRALSSLHLALLVRGSGAGRWQPVVSTLDDADAELVASAVVAGSSIDIRGAEFGARSVALSASPPADSVRAVLLRSVDEAVAPYRQMQFALAGLTLLGLLAFALGSLITARRVTTPLRTLLAATERLGSGDFETPLAGRYRADEIGELAHAFEHMRVRIADQQQEMRRLAYWDPLTGLPNRAQFRDRLSRAIERAGDGGTGLAVIMLDLDRFKHVNDVLGYAVGDRLLQGVGERLRTICARGSDVVARLSGDEFALLLPHADETRARSIAGRIERAFEQPLALGDQPIDLGAGIGIACWSPQAAGADAADPAGQADLLINRAELAMYAAKSRRDGALLYDGSLEVASGRTLSLLSDLRRAIERDEFRLYLQPKVGLDDGRIIGAEALIRWEHPERGLVQPAHFVPFAEHTGFIRAMTLWVFEQAAAAARTLQRNGLDLRLSINLSTRDLLDPALPDKFAALLERRGANADALGLEITESAIMDDPQRAQATLMRLRAVGFKLSIDDFGAGYSSLAYLKRLPVDELKIDRSFVMAMARDPDDAKIVRSTIDLAHNLGLRVVAEGVEDTATLRALRLLECDEAQGYHIARPMPSEAFADWCTRHEAQPRFEPSRPSLLVH